MKFFISHEFLILVVGSLFSVTLAFTREGVTDGIVFYSIVLTSLASTGISGYKNSYGAIFFSIRFIINTAITYLFTCVVWYFIAFILLVLFF